MENIRERLENEYGCSTWELINRYRELNYGDPELDEVNDTLIDYFWDLIEAGDLEIGEAETIFAEGLFDQFEYDRENVDYDLEKSYERDYVVFRNPNTKNLFGIEVEWTPWNGYSIETLSVFERVERKTYTIERFEPVRKENA